MRTCVLLVVSILVSVNMAQADSFVAAVSAGKAARKDVPVSVEVPLMGKQARPPLPVSASVEGRSQPGQIEWIGDGTARLWWVVADCPAGESRRYVLTVGRDADSKAWPEFRWKDSSGSHGKSMDLQYDNRTVIRYMYTPFDSKDVERTKKPHHLVFDPENGTQLTKGLGGTYPHHRGIFVGYKCTVDGKTYDIWHAHKGEHSVHAQEIRQIAGPVMGGHVVLIRWNDTEGKTFAEETRGVLVYAQPKGSLLIEFTSELRATGSPVTLGGDRQHAGVHWRAPQEVYENQKATRYLRPAQWASLPTDKECNTASHVNLPWNAVQYSLSGRGYTVADLCDPKNPKPAEFSERLYARFGEFIPYELNKDRTLSMRYRFWVSAGRSITREQIEQRYQDLADPPQIRLKGKE